MSEQPTSRHPARGVIVVAVVVAVVAAAVAWFLIRDDRPEARAGQQFSAAAPLRDVITTYVLVPTGRIEVVATGTLDGDAAAAAVRSHQEPGGGGFVGLQLSMPDPTDGTARAHDPQIAGAVRDGGTPVASQDRFAEVVDTPDPPAPRLTLVVDGHRYPLSALGHDGSASGGSPIPSRRFVAVAGTGAPVLEVSFAGRVQSVDLRSGERHAGAFAPLYRDRAVSLPCGTRTLTAGYADSRIAATCRITRRVTSPWYPVLGWAPAGRTWLGVGVATTAPDGFGRRTARGTARYDSSPNQGDRRIRLDGAAPRSVRVLSHSGVDEEVLVFDVPAAASTAPAGDLEVRVPWDSDLRDDSPVQDVAGLVTLTTAWATTV